nr:hypothetical protein CFP56_75882 [Quercus suber]
MRIERGGRRRYKVIRRSPDSGYIVLVRIRKADHRLMKESMRAEMMEGVRNASSTVHGVWRMEIGLCVTCLYSCNGSNGGNGHVKADNLSLLSGTVTCHRPSELSIE